MSRPLHILFLACEYNHPKMPNASGGYGSFVRLIAQELSSRGHKVSVFGFTGKKNFTFLDEKVEITIIKDLRKVNPLVELFRSLGKRYKSEFFGDLSIRLSHKYFYRHYRKLYKKQQVDIIETTDYSALFSEFNNDIPLIIRSHGSAIMLREYFGYKKISNPIVNFERKAFTKVNKLVSVSYAAKALNEKIFKTNDIEVIYNGLDIDNFKPIYNNEIPNSIFYFGTLSEGKGIEDLAIIFEKVANQNKQASLHLIGKGENYWTGVKEKHLSIISKEKVFYHGVADRKELPTLLSQASLIVFPTKGENFPFAFLEAMCLEKPVIINNIAVSKEIITDGIDGLISNSNEEFANKILTLLENKEYRNKLAKNAREKVLNHFTLQKMCDKTLEYYYNIIQQDF